jgi:hypothetical protein
MAMKKLFLSGVAALLLATGTAHADNEKREASFRQCHIRKWFSKDELAAERFSRRAQGHSGGAQGYPDSLQDGQRVPLLVI